MPAADDPLPFEKAQVFGECVPQGLVYMRIGKNTAIPVEGTDGDVAMEDSRKEAVRALRPVVVSMVVLSASYSPACRAMVERGEHNARERM